MDKTATVKLTTKERGDQAPLVATHAAQLAADFSATTVRESLTPAPGAKVVTNGRTGIIFIVPAAKSVAITVSWLQAPDPADPGADPTDSSQPRCAASRVVTLPVTPARASSAAKTSASRQGFSDFAVVPALKNPDLSPLQITARTTSRARLPSAKTKARTMVVPLRSEDKVRYPTKLPSPLSLSLARQCRLYYLSCGSVFTEVNSLVVDAGALGRGVVKGDLQGTRIPLARSQPSLMAARYGIGVEARPGAVRPGRPRPFGYDVQVRQSGRLLARARTAGRCVERRRRQGLVVECKIRSRSLQLRK